MSVWDERGFPLVDLGQAGVYKQTLEISEFCFPLNDLFPFEKHVGQAALGPKDIYKKIATLGLRAA